MLKVFIIIIIVVLAVIIIRIIENNITGPESIGESGITENVPANIADEGHKIISVKKINDNFSLIIEKNN